MQDTMLEEAIYKFKVSGPTIMPSLFDNFYLKETEAYNGYAILTYEVHQPLPIDEVLNIMDSDAYMRILYYTPYVAKVDFFIMSLIQFSTVGRRCQHKILDKKKSFCPDLSKQLPARWHK